MSLNSATLLVYLPIRTCTIRDMLWPILLALTVFVSLYDLRTKRVPNWVTLPLLIAGLIAHFPGVSGTILASAILVFAFINDWMGAGDVKLWLALIWGMPLSVSEKALPIMLTTFFMTSLVQLAWRSRKSVGTSWRRKTPLMGFSTPAAWRTIPFIVALWYVH